MSEEKLNPLQQAIASGINSAGQPLPKKCLICGAGNIEKIGAWMPDDVRAKLSLSSDRLRVIVYAVCYRCRVNPAIENLITQKIFTSSHGKSMDIKLVFDRSMLS